MAIDIQSTIFLMIFSFVAYLIATEENFIHYVSLLWKSARITVERMFWMIRLHPRLNNNFIARWLMYRKHLKIAKELEKEFQTKND